MHLGSDAEQLRPLLDEVQGKLLSTFGGQLGYDDLDRELRNKALVLAVGGGGGCGFVHLGSFGVLETLGLTPALIVGTSMGAIVGMFRARDRHFSQSIVSAVTDGLSFRKMFGVLDRQTRYAMPGALRLYLRTALSSFFTGKEGQMMRLSDLSIPFVAQVTGLRHDAAKGAARYERMFRKELRGGAIGRLLHVRDLVAHGVKLISEMASTPGALKNITLGSDEETLEFDTMDAAGFSAALPAIIQYDITRDDPRMRALVESVLKKNGVEFLADGGLVANVPARAAWEHVQSGRIGTRNACIVGLDCFAPTIGPHMLFLPLQRIAAENVARSRPFAQVMFTYRRPPSPTLLVPSMKAMDAAVRQGRKEFTRVGPVLQKFVEPLHEQALSDLPSTKQYD